MSTSAVLYVTNSSDHGSERITCIYQHWDGYPEGLLAEIQEAFRGCKIGGLPRNAKMFKNANSMDDFAAQLVVLLKKDHVGDVYIYPPNSEIDTNFVYDFTEKEGRLWVTAKQWGTPLFSCPLDEWSL